jgi:hypothetical protein
MMAPAYRRGPFLSDPTYLGMNEVQAVFASAGVAALIAVWAIFSQRAIAARNATIDFIRFGESDRDMIKANSAFSKLSREPAGLGPWASQPTSKEFTSIRTVLNHYELVAIAIHRGTFDDTTYRRWYRSGVIRAWNAAAPFVFARRNDTGNQALWHEFEEMARWYRGGQSMPQRRFFWRKFL